VSYAFSISPQNLLKQVNRGTAKDSSDIAQLEGIEPTLKHIESVMNNDVISVHADADDVEFAFEDEREMDPLKQAQVDQIYLNTGTYTRNEIREARGDDPRPEQAANELTVTTSNGVTSIDAIPEDGGSEEGGGKGNGEEDGEPEHPPSPRKAALKVRKISELRCVAGALTPRSRQARNEFATRLRKFLGEQRDRIASKARQEFQVLTTKVASDTSDVSRGTFSKGDVEDDTKRAAAILALLDWKYYDLYSIAQPYLDTAAEEGVHAGAYQAAANLGAPLQSTLTDALPKAKSAADARAAEMVGLEIQDDGTLAEATAPQWAISTTAKDDVLAAIKQGIIENWTPQQLEAVIQASIVWTPDHADLIADNEIARQQAGGHLTSWLASGKVLEYQWTVADLGCCPMCADFAALGPVKAGYMFAPLIFSPGAHPWCRCWLTVTKVEGQED
jgi:hypothetical protein